MLRLVVGSLALTAATIPFPAKVGMVAAPVPLGPYVSVERELPVSRSVVRQKLPAKPVKVVKVRAKPLTPRAYARSRLSAAQFSCLDRLFYRESQWQVSAYNRSSGATGIPQALPGHKMASAGPDWRTNGITQVRWGLTYIKERYGTPCAAWAHSEQRGWY